MYVIVTLPSPTFDENEIIKVVEYGSDDFYRVVNSKNYTQSSWAIIHKSRVKLKLTYPELFL